MKNLLLIKKLCSLNCVRFSSLNALSAGLQNDVFSQKAVRVTILGADTTTGEATAFLLKQNPLVAHVYLQGRSKVVGIAADLKHLDTRSRVSAYHGNDGIPHAIRNADIILLLGLSNLPADSKPEDRLKAEGTRVVQLAEACSRYAPKAVLTVCASPVSSTLPLVASVFRRTHWYHPSRIIGSVALSQIRANSLTARHQDLDPTSVHVPLLGGPDIDCVVPLFSRATPVALTKDECRQMTTRFKCLTDDDNPITTATACKLKNSPFSEAFALNRMVTTIALGMCGDSEAICTSFIRSNIINTCKHLVCTVKFGMGGVVHNYGVPKLTSFELKLFEKATLLLKKREQMALDFLSCLEHPPPVYFKPRQEKNAEFAD